MGEEEGKAFLCFTFSKFSERLQGKKQVEKGELRERGRGNGKTEDRRTSPETVTLVSHVAITPASNFKLSRFISQKSKGQKEQVIFLKETPQYLQMFWFILWGGEKA